MDDYSEREFSIGDLMSLTISRNDFEDLGAVIEMTFSHLAQTSHIILISFYSDNKTQINQKNLLLLCNYENTLLDNVLILSSLQKKNQQYKLKLLNKEIAYMKLYIAASYKNNSNNKLTQYNFTQIFNLKNLTILSQDEVSELSLSCNETLMLEQSEKNENLNLILTEIDKVNQSLIKEKAKVDLQKKTISDKEERINRCIIEFKQEMMLIGDRCYGQCLNEVNAKIYELTKKLQMAENNIMNKYRIIKEKVKNENKMNKVTSMANNNIGTNFKDKIANLEIKLKFLEDSNNSLKVKLTEKEEKIKQYITNEDKLNKMIKKLKDENVLLKSKPKDKNLNTTITSVKEKDNSIVKNVNITSNVNKPKKTLLSFEINKLQLEHFNRMMVNNIILNEECNSFQEKEITTMSLLIMNIATNPIRLFNKYEYGHILILLKLINVCISSNPSSIVAISSTLSEYVNKFPEFRTHIENFLLSQKEDKEDNINDISPICKIEINLNGNNIDLSQMIYSKSNAFCSFIQKSANKNNLINNEIIKLTSISNSLICILFTRSQREIIKHIGMITSKYIYTKVYLYLQFISKLNFEKLLIKLIDKTHGFKESVYQKIIIYLIDTMLILNSNNVNTIINNSNVLSTLFAFGSFIETLKQNIKLIEENTILFNKTILFLSTICICHPSLRNKIKDELSSDICIIEENKIPKKLQSTRLIKNNLNVLKSYFI